MEVFARKASGLVRTVSGRDVFIYNLGIINLGFGISYILGFGLPFYHGANMPLAVLVVALFCTAQVLTYYFFSVAMPRSGGEYVFISRSLHPVVGFAFSLSTVLWMLFYTAWSAANFASLGLGSLVTILGLQLDAPAMFQASLWLQSPTGMFVLGTLIVAAMTTLFVLGMRVVLRVQFWTFVAAMLGVAALFIVLSTTDRAEFVSAFNAFAAPSLGEDAYQTVLSVARSSGWETPGFSWSATVAAMVWPLFPLAYGWMSTSYGSEIRRIERSQLIGMPGAVLFAGALFIAIIALADRVMGLDFLGAIGWNLYVAPEGATEITPWFHLLAGLPATSLWLVLPIAVGFVMWTQFWVAGDLLYATRILFAWSIDRVVPDALNKVHPTRRTPINSILLCTLVTEVFLALYVFTEWFTSLIGALPIAVMYVVLGIAAVVFPFARREMFERSPVSRWRIGKLPIMSVVGAVTALFMGFMVFLMFGDELAAGPRRTALFLTATPIVLGVIAFYVAGRVRKRRGVDVSLAYKEIPIE